MFMRLMVRFSAWSLVGSMVIRNKCHTRIVIGRPFPCVCLKRSPLSGPPDIHPRGSQENSNRACPYKRSGNPDYLCSIHTLGAYLRQDHVAADSRRRRPPLPPQIARKCLPYRSFGDKSNIICVYEAGRSGFNRLSPREQRWV